MNKTNDLDRRAAPLAYRRPHRRRPARRRWLVAAPALAAVLALGACQIGGARGAERDFSAGGWTPNTSGKIGGVSVGDLQEALKAQLEADARPKGVREQHWTHVKELYAAYDNAPLFLEEDGLRDRARAVVHALAVADSDGLSLDGYPIQELREALAEVKSGKPSAGALARADLLLTTSYVALGEDLITGQISPSSVSQNWHIDPQHTDVDSALARTLRAGRFDQALAAMRPQNDSYTLMRQQLGRYRQIVRNGGWARVPDGKTLKPGDRAPAARLDALRSRLQTEGLLGDAAATSAPAPRDTGRVGTRAPAAGQAVYDSVLAGAVATFQARHGIVVDSLLGGQTLESLNLPAEYRLGQIAANMERQRWLPRTLGRRYILVNVPAFHLQAFDSTGNDALDMRVIVGSEYNDRSTPTFADTMSYVVFRPYWNVPDEIAEKEIYPKQQADPSYFATRNYETFTEGGQTHVRQKPGGDNSLGLVKFIFPNEFAIYLHDTPEDELFKQDIRAASHGCIRLEKPAELAQWVLGWDAARVQQAMNSGPDDERVNLQTKLPVYIVYFTTFERDGELWFGNDIYDRDQAIVKAVTAAVQPNAAARAQADSLAQLIAD